MKRAPARAVIVSAFSVLASLLFGLTTSATSAAATPSPFTAYINVGDPASVSALGHRIGTHISLGSDYFDDSSWAAIDDTWNMNNWAGTGYRMIWGVPMLPTSGATLASGASGAYDSHYVTVAKDLVAHGMGNAILRLGWEFNEQSYPWYAAGQASAFVAYWRHIVNAMRSVSGANFAFEWNPAMGDNGGGDKAMGDFASYYPGNSYVDVVAMDVYDIAWNNYPGEAAEFSSIQSRTYGLNWLDSFAGQHGKPLAIAEFGLGWGGSTGNGKPYSGSGTVCGGDDPAFVNDMAAWMRGHNAVISGFWDNAFSSIEKGKNPMTAAAVANQFGPNAPTTTSTTKHRSHLRGAQRFVTHVLAGASNVSVRGKVLPARSGRVVIIQTARSAHATTWHTQGRVRTGATGHYSATIARGAHAGYVRVVSTIAHHAAHSRAYRIA
ncbi:MAG: glycoside hydrolase family 26 protein [Mycobacteriales bacterium]